MPLNLGPNPSVMQRIMGGTNAMAQGMNTPFSGAARLTAGLNQNRINRNPLLGARQVAPNMGMMPPGLPGSQGMGINVSPSMPNVGMPPTQPNMMGRNFDMGGFTRPNIETGNMNDGRMGSGLWSSYRNRPLLG